MTPGPRFNIRQDIYRKNSCSLEAVRSVVDIITALWNLAGTSAALLPRWLSNVSAIEQFWIQIFRGLETLGDLIVTCLIRYWNGAHLVDWLVLLTYVLIKKRLYIHIYSKNIGPNEGCMFLWSGWSLAQAMACRLISLRLWPKYWYFLNLKPRKQTSLTKQSHY